MKAIIQGVLIAYNFFEFENFQNNEKLKKNSFHGNIDTNQQTQWNRTNIRCWSQCCNLINANAVGRSCIM